MNYAPMEEFWSEKPALLGVSITFSLIPAVAVGLRFWARILQHRPDVSDYLALASMIFVVAYWCVILVMAYETTDLSTPHEEFDIAVVASQCVFISIAVWILATYICKLSILFLYYKLFTSGRTALTWILRALIVLVGSCGLATFLSLFLTLQPLSAWWSIETDDQMVAAVQMNMAMDIMSLTTDVITFAIPLFMIGSLSKNSREKKVLMVVFALGFITCLIVLIRCILFYAVDDPYRSIAMSMIITGLEPSLGVAVTSIPLMNPLLKYFGLIRGSQGTPQPEGFRSIGKVSIRRSRIRDRDLELLESQDDLVTPDFTEREKALNLKSSNSNSSTAGSAV